jgi:hypothetical protein
MTTLEEINGQIAEVTGIRNDLEVQFADISARLREAQDELERLAGLKLMLSDTDYTSSPEDFKRLCDKVRAYPGEHIFRKKMEEVIRSLPLPEGVSIRNITMAPFTNQPSLSLDFRKDITFSDEDAELLVNVIEFTDMGDGFMEHSPVSIHEWALAAHGVYTLVLDRNNEHARLYRQFFHQTTVVEDGTIAEVMTEISRDYYGERSYNTDLPDWDSEEED